MLSGSSSLASEGGPFVAVCHEFVQTVGEGVDVLRGHEKSRLAFFDERLAAGCACADGGHTARHRLQGGVTERLGIAGEEEDIRRRICRRESFSFEVTGEDGFGQERL